MGIDGWGPFVTGLGQYKLGLLDAIPGKVREVTGQPDEAPVGVDIDGDVVAMRTRFKSGFKQFAAPLTYSAAIAGALSHLGHNLKEAGFSSVVVLFLGCLLIFYHAHSALPAVPTCVHSHV